VRYNALPTLSLSQTMASRYGVRRDAGTALILIALRTVENGEEIDADGDVTVSVADLTGARQRIRMESVTVGEYTDHIGTARISPRDSYRFEIDVKAAGRSEKVQFQRNF
jgi:hypothetical protein